MMFCGPFASELKHPLDTFRDRLLPCKSITEVRNSLFEAERSIHSEGKQIINPGGSGEKDFDPTWGNMLHKYGNDPDADVTYDAMLARQKAGDELRSIAIEREANSNVMSDEDRKRAQIREQIISEYGSYIEKNPPGLEFRDISELPYPKEQILDAISLEIVRENNDLRNELLKVFAEMLANFQENVGPTPVTTLGISDTELIAAARMSSTATGRGDFSEVKDFALKFAAKIANNPDKEKYELLRKVADEELVSIQSRLMAAEELSRQMPEAKKRQILG